MELPKFKIIFLGDPGVGKSSILQRFCQNKFDENYQATVGLDFHSKNTVINKVNVRLNFYDTAGQEKFKSLIPMYIRDANIIIIVYNICSKESFEHVKDWLKEVNLIKKTNALIAIVGNKIDLNDREVTDEESDNLAKEYDYIVSSLSAKTGDGVDYFFEQLFNKIAVEFDLNNGDNKNNDNDLNVTEKFDLTKINSTKPEKKKCCKM